MNNIDQTLNNFESELRILSQFHLNDFHAKAQVKKGINGLNYKLKLLSKITEKLANDVVNKSIDYIRKNKIKDNATINNIVRLNHKYILRFKRTIKLTA